jgi:hypothetical protein
MEQCRAPPPPRRCACCALRMHGGKGNEPESTLGYLWGRVFGGLGKAAGSSAVTEGPQSVVSRAPSAPLSGGSRAPLPPLHDRSPLRRLRTVEPGKAPPKAQARRATTQPYAPPPARSPATAAREAALHAGETHPRGCLARAPHPRRCACHCQLVARRAEALRAAAAALGGRARSRRPRRWLPLRRRPPSGRSTARRAGTTSWRLSARAAMAWCAPPSTTTQARRGRGAHARARARTHRRFGGCARMLTGRARVPPCAHAPRRARRARGHQEDHGRLLPCLGAPRLTPPPTHAHARARPVAPPPHPRSDPQLPPLTTPRPPAPSLPPSSLPSLARTRRAFCVRSCCCAS